MPELRELKKKSASSPSRKKPKKLLIGLLALLVLVLVFVFLREKKQVRLDVVDSGIGTPSSETKPSEALPPSSLDENVSREAVGSEDSEEDSPAGGRIRIGEEAEEPQENLPVEQEKIVPIPKEELAFFEPLRNQRQKRVSPKANNKPPERAVKTPKVLYTIQLGAFKNKKGADALAIRLRKGGYEAYLLAENGQLYKVRVGEFQSKKAAKKVADQIRKSEKIDAFITRDD